MKRFNIITLMVVATMLLTSCEIIGGIFKAGVWSGVLIVVVVIVLVLWLIFKVIGGRRD